jgi:hypothetical protein
VAIEGKGFGKAALLASSLALAEKTIGRRVLSAEY